MGEDILQRWIVELLRPLLQRWLDERGQLALVGADQFIYFKQFDAHERVSPDVYVLPGVHPETHIPSWKTWETNIVPSFALEVVSKDWRKDYDGVPEKYARLGTTELVIFDPYFSERSNGVRWQRRLRNAAGELPVVERTDATSIDSFVLGCALRVTGSGHKQRIRLAVAKDSTILFPTAEEAERQAKEVERQAKEVERQAKEAALIRIAELEAELAKLR